MFYKHIFWLYIGFNSYSTFLSTRKRKLFNKKRMSHCLVLYDILLCRMNVRTLVKEKNYTCISMYPCV